MKKLLLGLLLMASGLNAEEIYYRSLGTNVTTSTTTNLTQSTVVHFDQAVDYFTVWTKLSGASSAVVANGVTTYISPVWVTGSGTNLVTNIVSFANAPHSFASTPNGATNTVDCATFQGDGYDGIAITGSINISGGTLTNTYWVTFPESR